MAKIKDYQRQVFKMSTLRVNINQQLAEIGVRSTPARLHISMPKGQLNITKTRPQMQIEKQIPTFRVNRQKISNESGLKSPLELAKTFRNEGRSAAFRGIAQNKNDGNFLANHRIPGDKAVPMLARNKAMSRLQKPEANIGLMPSSPPEITWDKGYMRVNWSDHSVVIDWQGDYKPEITADQYSVEVFLRTQPYFRVMVEEAVNTGVGRYVDQAI